MFKRKQLDSIDHIDKKLLSILDKYTKYVLSDKHKAVLFVQKHLKKNAHGRLIDINVIEAPKYYEIGYQQFKTVICTLYKQKLKPAYPDKKLFTNKDEYKRVCNAIDWDAAQKEIAKQKKDGVKGEVYKIEGVIYLDDSKRPPMFISSAPDNVKAIANDINDKSNKAWELAYKYINPDYMNYDPYKYKIKTITKIK